MENLESETKIMKTGSETAAQIRKAECQGPKFYLAVKEHWFSQKSILSFLEFKSALLAFCGNQVCVVVNSSLHQKNQVCVSENSSLHQKDQGCVSENSRVHRKNQVCVAENSSCHQKNHVFVTNESGFCFKRIKML